MQATNLDRYGCTLGGRRIKYSRLLQYYVCNGCGGKLTHTFVGGDRVFCATCGGEDFVSEHAFLMQVYDAQEVLRSLPPEFRKLYVDEDEQPQDAEQTIAELFG